MSRPIRVLWIASLLAQLVGSAHSLFAQSSPSSAGSAKGFLLYESFEGDSSPDGQVMVVTSSAAYRFGEHFSAAIGIPIYVDHFPASATGTSPSTSAGIGNVFALARAEWRNSLLNYATTLTGSVATGDTKKGLSTGHATFDWSNRFEHEISVVTPFLTVGIANSISDTRYFLRPFTTYGDLAHSEAGTDVDLTHEFTLTLSGYDIAPWGTQTLISRVVPAGVAGKAGGVPHGRAFENNHQTTGGSTLTRDDGFTVGLSFSPKKYLDLDLGYARSARYALNSVSFAVGVNLSSLLGKSPNSIR